MSELPRGNRRGGAVERDCVPRPDTVYDTLRTLSGPHSWQARYLSVANVPESSTPCSHRSCWLTPDRYSQKEAR
jgi:hypothetical protein